MPRARLSLLVLPLSLVAACSTDATAPVDSPAERMAAASVASGVTVVMTGLRSPRGLDWGPEGSLYVTEAGMATLAGGCVPFMEGPMLQTKCWSGTGGVSRLWRGQQTRIASDLPSSYIVQSGFTSGPQDLSVAGGHLFVTLGVLAEDKSRFVADAGGNSLLEVGANGRISVTKATLCHRLCRSVTANGA